MGKPYLNAVALFVEKHEPCVWNCISTNNTEHFLQIFYNFILIGVILNIEVLNGAY